MVHLKTRKKMIETKKGFTNRNLFCGYELSIKEQEYLIRSTQNEFLKPIIERRTPLELVNETRKVIKYSKKWLNL